MSKSSWGRYVGGADMGMLEFASYEAKDYTSARQAKKISNTFGQTAPVKAEQPSKSVDLTSNLFDD